MSRKRALYFILCMCLLCMNLSGCSHSEKEAASGEVIIDKPQIGISFDTFILERWLKDRDVFVATAQRLGAEVDVQNANGDVLKQNRQIRQFVDNGMDVIVVVAVDCYAVTDEVENARNHGIEVVSYDRLIQGTATDLYISVDNELIGREMGNVMCSQTEEDGNIAMLCGPEIDANTQDVAKGFEDVLAENNRKIIKKVNLPTWTPDYAAGMISEILQEYPDLDGVMCGNDGLAGGVIQELSRRQLAGRLVVTGQDADVDACQRVVEGTQAMTVYKPIEDMAKKAAEFAVELVDKGSVSDVKERKCNDVAEIPYYALKPIAVTKENMDEIVIDSGFHLRSEVYLNVE